MGRKVLTGENMVERKGRYRHTTDGEKSSGEIKRDDRHQLDRECQQAVENPWSNSNHCCQ